MTKNTNVEMDKCPKCGEDSKTWWDNWDNDDNHIAGGCHCNNENCQFVYYEWYTDADGHRINEEAPE